MDGEGPDEKTRHVYGNGGLRKVQALALCIHKGRVRYGLGILVRIITALF